jgi:hypothetical protein
VNIKRMAHDRKWGDGFGDRNRQEDYLEPRGDVRNRAQENRDRRRREEEQGKLRNWSAGGGKSGGKWGAWGFPFYQFPDIGQ